MAGRKKALESEVIPAWSVFLRRLLRARGAKNALSKALVDLGPPLSNIQRARRIGAKISWISRMTRNRKPTYPEFGTVWMVGAAARKSLGHHWCAGPVALFAASHFDAFVHVMVGATRIPTSRRAALLAAVGATQGGATSVQARATWELSDEETAAFEASFVQYNRGASLPRNFDLDVCVMAADAYSAPLSVRRRVIVEFLGRWIRA